MSSANDYQFITHWRLPGNIQRAYELLSDPLSYASWWKGVQLKTILLSLGDSNGIGRKVNLEMRGWLPYTLRWQLTGIENQKPNRFSAESTGDLNGVGVWTLKQEGEIVDLVFDWRVRADKAFLKYFSCLLKPLFSANHDWVMKRWEESLRDELSEK